MSFFTLSGISVVFSCLAVAFISFIFGREKIHYVLGLFNIAVANWGIGLTLVGMANSPEEALIAWKIAFISGYFIGPIFFHLVTIFCRLERNLLIYLGYGQAVFFVIATLFTQNVFYETRFVFSHYFITDTAFFTAAILLYVFYVLLSFFELLRSAISLRGVQRSQTLFVASSFSLGFLGGTSSFLPIYSVDIFYPAGNFLIMFYAILFSYGVLKHRF
jgi:hypothetical protein